MYLDLYQHLDDMKARLGESSKTYQKALRVASEFSDVRLYEDNGVAKICTHEVNPFVDRLDVTREGNFYVYPYTIDKGQPVYSDPPYYFLGYQNTEGFGIVPLADWEEDMIADRINPDLIKKAKFLLAQSAVVDYREA